MTDVKEDKPSFIVKNPILNEPDSILIIESANNAANQNQELVVEFNKFKYIDKAILVNEENDFLWEININEILLKDKILKVGENEVRIGFKGESLTEPSIIKLNFKSPPKKYTIDLSKLNKQKLKQNIKVAMQREIATYDDKKRGAVYSALTTRSTSVEYVILDKKLNTKSNQILFTGKLSLKTSLGLTKHSQYLLKGKSNINTEISELYIKEKDKKDGEWMKFKQESIEVGNNS